MAVLGELRLSASARAPSVSPSHDCLSARLSDELCYELLSAHLSDELLHKLCNVLLSDDLWLNYSARYSRMGSC